MIASSGPRTARHPFVALLAAALVAVLATLGVALPASAATPSVTHQAPAAAVVQAVPGEDSGLPVRALSSLPPEASET